ncbi:MAG: SDR family oxidoreductase [Deltaproteobacteria bacterium]|nr:MAG: SDR family oxidoreductase [Deltaproteobacteria bacterium]
MEGKVVLVTGANAGIGKATALGLAKMGATVVITARNQEKGLAAQREIQQKSGNSKVELMLSDFLVLEQVQQLASTFVSKHKTLDVLINNAGLILSDRKETVDGNEATLQVNHLAPFLLTSLLLECLQRAPSARVINVSSDAHKGARSIGKTMDELNFAKGYSAFGAYCQSKLANVLFTRELAKRVDPSNITVNSLHPGVVRTRFGVDGDIHGFFGYMLMLLRPFMSTPTTGAKTSVFLASSPAVEGVTGKYFARSKMAEPSEVAKDDELAKRLWDMSVTLTGASW